MQDNHEMFTGGLEELGSVEEAVDKHQAVGRWWAKAILNALVNNEFNDSANSMVQKLTAESLLAARSEVEYHIAGFAKALEHVSRQNNLVDISTDYDPSIPLCQAVDLADMPVRRLITFPWMTRTFIEGDIVKASMGYGAEPVQIWPPLANQPR